MNRPVAYKGNEPYVFVSYCHQDDIRIWPVIEGLQTRGVRVWYDEGIEWGSHWDEVIFEHLAGCTCVIGFVTDSFLKSENCMDEISYAKDEQKGPFLVFMDKLELTGMMKFRYGRLQALSLSQFNNVDALLDTLCETRIFSTCRSAAPKPAPQSVPKKSNTIEVGKQSDVSPKPTVTSVPGPASAPAPKAAPRTVTLADKEKAGKLALEALEKYRESKFEDAFRLSNEALELEPNNSKANLLMGWLYHFGLSVKEDKVKALKHFYQSQEPLSYNCIGCYHYYGWGGKTVDKREALQYFMMGKTVNNHSATCNAAQCLTEGIVLNPKTSRRERMKYSKQYLEEAADKGSLRACTVLVMDHLDYPSRVLKKYEEKYDAVKKKNPYTGVIEAEKNIWKNVYAVSMGLLLE